jgi:hypothetical protein
MDSVSQILLDDHGVTLSPGAKGPCPFCKHDTFYVKADDSIGKCFHPACAQFIAAGWNSAASRPGIVQVLKRLYQDFHAELLTLATGQRNAYTYLRDERGIDPQVITEAMLEH